MRVCYGLGTADLALVVFFCLRLGLWEVLTDGFIRAWSLPHAEERGSPMGLGALSGSGS